MRSTGEVMGVATAMSLAFAKSTAAAGMALPDRGRVFVSVRDEDKAAICHVARRLRNLGFEVVATDGTARAIALARIAVQRVNKVGEGSPHVVDAIQRGEIQIVINTTQGASAIRDSYSIRRHALLGRVPYFTTVEAALALTDALERATSSATARRPCAASRSGTPAPGMTGPAAAAARRGPSSQRSGADGRRASRRPAGTPRRGTTPPARSPAVAREVRRRCSTRAKRARRPRARPRAPAGSGRALSRSRAPRPPVRP
jgi:hypothetical protein